MLVLKGSQSQPFKWITLFSVVFLFFIFGFFLPLKTFPLLFLWIPHHFLILYIYFKRCSHLMDLYCQCPWFTSHQTSINCPYRRSYPVTAGEVVQMYTNKIHQMVMAPGHMEEVLVGQIWSCFNQPQHLGCKGDMSLYMAKDLLQNETWLGVSCKVVFIHNMYSCLTDS